MDTHHLYSTPSAIRFIRSLLGRQMQIKRVTLKNMYHKRWESSYRTMFDRKLADFTNHQIQKNGDQRKRNYNLRCFNEKIIGRRENQVKHRPTVTRLAKFKPLRPMVCLGNANAILLRLKIHALCANPFFFVVFFCLSRPLKTATKSSFVLKCLWARIDWSGYWIKLIYVIY